MAAIVDFVPFSTFSHETFSLSFRIPAYARKKITKTLKIRRHGMQDVRWDDDDIREWTAKRPDSNGIQVLQVHLSQVSQEVQNLPPPEATERAHAVHRCLSVALWNAVSTCRSHNHTTHATVRYILPDTFATTDLNPNLSSLSAEPDRYFGTERRITLREDDPVVLAETGPQRWECNRVIPRSEESNPGFWFTGVMFADFGYLTFRRSNGKVIDRLPRPAQNLSDRLAEANPPLKSDFHKSWDPKLKDYWSPKLEGLAYSVKDRLATIKITFFDAPFLQAIEADSLPKRGLRYDTAWWKDPESGNWQMDIQARHTPPHHEGEGSQRRQTDRGSSLRVGRTLRCMDIAFIKSQPGATEGVPDLPAFLGTNGSVIKAELARYWNTDSQQLNSIAFARALRLPHALGDHLGRIDWRQTTVFAKVKGNREVHVKVTCHAVHWPSWDEPFHFASLSLSHNKVLSSLDHAQAFVREAEHLAAALAPPETDGTA
ncbi:hypothetical protein HDU88_008729 [Geranomyces variabilis]|nr:hypothetical protein HDU88_008729 [Geranomyces variabilis]